MEVRITARHCQLSPSLEKVIRNKVAKLERYMTRLHDAHVVVASEGAGATVEMTVGWARKQQFSANAAGDKPEQAVAFAQTKLEKQLRRCKRRLIGQRND